MRSSSEMDILRPMTEVELRELIEMYKRKGDRYHHVSIYNNNRWNRLLAKGDSDRTEMYLPLKKSYYTHRYGNLEQNGTFICLEMDIRVSIQFHTYEESLTELKECFAQTKLIDWKSGPILISVHPSYGNEILSFITTLGGVIDSVQPYICHVLTQSNALKVGTPSIPDGYKLIPLEDKHAYRIHATYPYKDLISVDFVRGLIEYNITLGIFRQKDDKLVAYIIQNEFFGLGLLQVIPEERSKGFGQLLSQALTKKIAICDAVEFIIAHTAIGNKNPAIISKKIGFEEHCITEWFYLKNIASDASAQDRNSRLLRSRL